MASNKEIKFIEEELDKINEFQQRYLTIQMSFGQVEITKMRLVKQLEDLDVAAENLKDQFEKTQEEEREFIQGVNDKYGDGVLDPATGIFTPSQVTVSTDESKTEPTSLDLPKIEKSDKNKS